MQIVTVGRPNQERQNGQTWRIEIAKQLDARMTAQPRNRAADHRAFKSLDHLRVDGLLHQKSQCRADTLHGAGRAGTFALLDIVDEAVLGARNRYNAGLNASMPGEPGPPTNLCVLMKMAS